MDDASFVRYYLEFIKDMARRREARPETIDALLLDQPPQVGEP